MNVQLRYKEGATDRDWALVLATFPLFAGVRKRHLRKLVRNATFAEPARGEIVLSNGARTDSLYLVLGGEARAVRPTPRSFGTGDYFGELGVLGDEPHALYVVAGRDLHLMRVQRKRVLALARRHPRLTMTLLKDLSRQLRPATAG